MPSESGLELQSLDRTANPCDDFYQFACGGWVAHNPIPAGRGGWNSNAERVEHTGAVLHDILEVAAGGGDPATKQIGDYYAACMDAGAANAQGLTALDPELRMIAALGGPADLPEIVARLHTVGLSPSIVFSPSAAFFTFQAWPDFEDASVVRPLVRQGGMGLRGREDYVETNARVADIRTQYVRHVANMLRLAGESPESAEAGAAAVMRIETALARAAAGRPEWRNPVGPGIRRAHVQRGAEGRRARERPTDQGRLRSQHCGAGLDVGDDEEASLAAARIERRLLVHRMRACINSTDRLGFMPEPPVRRSRIKFTTSAGVSRNRA